jgi:predicted GTPase
VACFTGLDIPDGKSARYPAELAGPLYPEGIPILPEAGLNELVYRYRAREVIFARTEVTFEYLSQMEQRVVFEAGSEFQFAQVTRCMLPCRQPVVSVCGTSTGCGKTRATQRISEALRTLGRKPVIAQYPKNCGMSQSERVRRFADISDLEALVPEELRTEYEWHIRNGETVYTGIDWEAIVDQASEEGDILVWDGGNNDIPFVQPSVYVTVVDLRKPGSEVWYPSYVNVELAHLIFLNHRDSASTQDIERITTQIRRINSNAIILTQESEWPDAIAKFQRELRQKPKG